jgi:anti-sigma regulatory factor (Ser/Thr protein kinase)
MYTFIDSVINEQLDAKCSKIFFNFGQLQFIEPVGVVVLSNLIEYFKKLNVSVWFKGHTSATLPIKFLDDSGFFKHYLSKSLFESSAVRVTTIPLHLVANDRATEFLYFKLMPWIENEVGLTESSLATVRSSIEEIFHNIRDHSGVNIGCAFAQHYPKKSEIQVAISDFGFGIPQVVRNAIPELTDPEAIRKACEEGFTTRSNVQNRGAGLPHLMRYVTQRNNGTVLIASGKGEISASKSSQGTKLTVRNAEGFYPGTLVRVILRTDTFERVAEDAQLEPFEW